MISQTEKMSAMNKNGVKWSREETILAFELYCRMPLVRQAKVFDWDT